MKPGLFVLTWPQKLTRFGQCSVVKLYWRETFYTHTCAGQTLCSQFSLHGTSCVTKFIPLVSAIWWRSFVCLARGHPHNNLSSHLLSKHKKIRIKKINFTCCFVWVWNVVSYVKGRTGLNCLKTEKYLDLREGK